MHQAKRRNKDSPSTISSFFPHEIHSVKHTDENTSERPLISRDPFALPASVQSSLINVGMRVRKAIPEGYKAMTDDNNSSSATFSGLPTNHRDLEAAPLHAHLQTTVQDGNPNSYRFRRSDRRELTPFCGLLKVGNWGQQWETEERTITEQSQLGSRIVTNDINDHDVPILCSQGSTISSSSNYNEQRPKKRRFSDGSECSTSSPSSLKTTCENRIHVDNAKQNPKKTFQFSLGGPFDDDFEDAEFLDYEFLSGEEESMYG